MSYVIQNFYDSNRKISFTPRFKFLIVLNNLEKFLIFIKLNTFFFFSNKTNILNLNPLFNFFKYFFSNQYLKLFSQLNLTLSGSYTNNVTKSSILYIFWNLNNFFKKSSLRFKNYLVSDYNSLNLYYLPLKTFNLKLTNSFYKNIFFFLMIFNFSLWYQHSSTTKFYLNFLLLNYVFKISRFYNGHFLRVYNY